jgi:hypothetical protein
MTTDVVSHLCTSEPTHAILAGLWGTLLGRPDTFRVTHRNLSGTLSKISLRVLGPPGRLGAGPGYE